MTPGLLYIIFRVATTTHLLRLHMLIMQQANTRGNPTAHEVRSGSRKLDRSVVDGSVVSDGGDVACSVKAMFNM